MSGQSPVRLIKPQGTNGLKFCQLIQALQASPDPLQNTTGCRKTSTRLTSPPRMMSFIASEFPGNYQKTGPTSSRRSTQKLSVTSQLFPAHIHLVKANSAKSAWVNPKGAQSCLQVHNLFFFYKLFSPFTILGYIKLTLYALFS